MRAIARRTVVLVSLAAAPFALHAADKPRVRVDTTRGSFVIELEADRAPLTVEHFLQYVSEGYYEGTTFHRVIQGGIAQAGGFTAALEAKPAERTVPNESGN